MTSNPAVRLSTAPNSLQRKLGRLSADNSAAVARAQAAVDDLSGNFASWLDDAMVQLETAFSAVTPDNLSGPPGELLYRKAHDVKGVGATCQSQTTHRISASLCRLLETPELRAIAPLTLVSAHLTALRAVMRLADAQDDAEIANALAQELEAKVATFEARLN